MVACSNSDVGHILAGGDGKAVDIPSLGSSSTDLSSSTMEVSNLSELMGLLALDLVGVRGGSWSGRMTGLLPCIL